MKMNKCEQRLLYLLTPPTNKRWQGKPVLQELVMCALASYDNKPVKWDVGYSLQMNVPLIVQGHA